MKIANEFYSALFVLFIGVMWPFIELYCIDYVSRLSADELEALDGTVINSHRLRWTRVSTAAKINEFLSLTNQDPQDVVDAVYEDIKDQNEKSYRRISCQRIRWCENQVGSSPWSLNGRDRDVDEISNPYIRGKRGPRSHITDNMLFEECIHGNARAPIQQACSSRREDVCRYAASISIWGGCGLNVDITSNRRRKNIDRSIANGFEELTAMIRQEELSSKEKARLVRLAHDWADVAAEIAMTRTEKQRSDALVVLGRIRDPIHDYVWPKLCKRHKGQYQTCPRSVWYIREHMEVAYWAIFITVGGVYVDVFFKFYSLSLSLSLSCVCNRHLQPHKPLYTNRYAVFLYGEYVVGNQLILSVVLSRLLRVISFMTTTLPPLNPECRMRFRSVGDGGGCGDLLFSGHATLVVTGICFVWTMDVPFRIPRFFCVLATLVGFHELATSAVEKMHYTADIFLGIVVTALVYYSLGHALGFFQRQQRRAETQVKVSKDTNAFMRSMMEFPKFASLSLLVACVVGLNSNGSDPGLGVCYGSIVWFLTWLIIAFVRSRYYATHSRGNDGMSTTIIGTTTTVTSFSSSAKKKAS